MAALGIIGIIVGVAVLIYGAYKGISTIILAPLCALLIALFNGMNLLTTFTDTMLPSVCNYVTAMLGPVLMGCVIAALYNASGAAISLNGFPSQNRACRQLACRGVRVARASRSRSIIRARAASCSRSVSFSIRISSGEAACSGK